MIEHGELQFSTKAYSIPRIQELVSDPLRMLRVRKYADRAAGRVVRWRGSSSEPMEGALTDLIQRNEVVAAFLNLELAQADRDPEYLEVEKHIREIVEVSVPHVSDKS